MMKRKMLLWCLIVALLFSGCKKTPAPASGADEVETGESDVLAEPDPSGAIEAVYAQEALNEVVTEVVDDARMQEILVNPDFVAEDLYARYSNPKNGLADVIIVKAGDGDNETMFTWLYRYQDRRVAEFENYDILDAHAIA